MDKRIIAEMKSGTKIGVRHLLVSDSKIMNPLKDRLFEFFFFLFFVLFLNFSFCFDDSHHFFQNLKDFSEKCLEFPMKEILQNL